MRLGKGLFLLGVYISDKIDITPRKQLIWAQILAKSLDKADEEEEPLELELPPIPSLKKQNK
jgi:hypothetical protein